MAEPDRIVVGDCPPRSAAVLERSAVRAVIRSGSELLMLHSAVSGDYKFPGGGMESGESAPDTLAREVLEECGRRVTAVGAELFIVDEARPGLEPGVTLRMRSTYVACEVSDEVAAQALDDYERDLALLPVWVTPDEALRTNRAVLAAGGAQPWVAREVAVLGHLLSDR